MRSTFRVLALLTAALPSAYLSAAPVVVTATFQQGTSGYSGAFDRRIGPTAANEVNGADVDTVTTSYFLDGGGSSFGDGVATQGLIRFDSLLGAGGVPAGAKIISATLDMVTGSTSNAHTGGAYNLYQLATPFDSTSSWSTTFGGDGLTGDVVDLLGSYDDLAQGSMNSARADNAVQAWVDGAPNYGFGIRSDRSNDGWSPHTTGSSTVADRPQLTVNYTVDPLVNVRSYQNGVNGYSDTTDIRLNNADGSTTLGSADPEPDIDGVNATDSQDRPYFIRFDNLDLSAGQVYKAELVLTTGFSSANADSPGPVQVHQLLRDWDTNLVYADLDSNGDPLLTDLTELQANGDIGPVAATVVDMQDTEVMHIDVTSIVQNWRQGAPNYGFYLGTIGTSNGWQLFSTGAAEAGLRPELRIITVIPEPAAATLLASCLAAAALGHRRR
ncbi:MAG TPA: DNRLRE domain-containing protein [Lacipirellula sp.]